MSPCLDLDRKSPARDPLRQIDDAAHMIIQIVTEKEAAFHQRKTAKADDTEEDRRGQTMFPPPCGKLFSSLKLHPQEQIDQKEQPDQARCLP